MIATFFRRNSLSRPAARDARGADGFDKTMASNFTGDPKQTARKRSVLYKRPKTVSADLPSLAGDNSKLPKATPAAPSSPPSRHLDVDHQPQPLAHTNSDAATTTSDAATSQSLLSAEPYAAATIGASSSGIKTRPRPSFKSTTPNARHERTRSMMTFISSRPMSVDEAFLSERVRLMYARGESDVSDAEVKESLNANASSRHGEPSIRSFERPDRESRKHQTQTEEELQRKLHEMQLQQSRTSDDAPPLRKEESEPESQPESSSGRPRRVSLSQRPPSRRPPSRRPSSSLPPPLAEEEDHSGSDSESHLQPRPQHSRSQTRPISMVSACTSKFSTNQITREKDELAGGFEDYRDVAVSDVDRYGFIVPNKTNNQEQRTIQRVPTSLLLASTKPRRKKLMDRQVSIASNSAGRGRATSNPPTKLGYFGISGAGTKSRSNSTSRPSDRSGGSSNIRLAAKLPYQRYRRFIADARDMLTSPYDEATDEDYDEGNGNALNPQRRTGPHADALRRKEVEREEKWHKMAKVIKSPDGSGTRFEFDTQSSKVIERTWKGIPDRWRATAWHSFLSASARKHVDSLSDEELIEIFFFHQDQPSPDDVQIDLDVPRTINNHIMFRRRYRGGQRSLFRVLHAMSLYFPDTGYVQGMASLAATLLAYYDEERAFVMLVRLWQLRGLERLYRLGFDGLMEALSDFETSWLNGGEVAEKLRELGIPPTTYGTRWYLTLFNYSIPFPAQLRVWDVFMLLGDSCSSEPIIPNPSFMQPFPDNATVPPGSAHSESVATISSYPEPSVAGGTTTASAVAGPISQPSHPFGKSLDALHATSAALIDGMKDIILDSDFENAMKVLTGWVPIRDVDMLMRIARVEWKVHGLKKKT